MIVTNNGSFPGGPAPGGAIDQAVLDRLTRAAIDAQVRAGCGLITDGMMRSRDPVAPLCGALGGLAAGGQAGDGPAAAPAGRPVAMLPWGARFTVPVVETEVSWLRPILVEDFLFASRDAAVPVKPVLLGPYTLARLAEDRAYGDPMALAMALAAALNQELRALQAAGASFIQINEPALLQRREEFPLFTRIWEVLGRGIAVTLCLHLEGGDLRGLYPGVSRLKRLGCLSLDCVAGPENLRVLGEAPFPDGLRLGLGLVDGRRTSVESPEDLMAAIEAAEGLPPRDRILLGNATDLGDLDVETASAKLRGLARAAA